MTHTSFPDWAVVINEPEASLKQAIARFAGTPYQSDYPGKGHKSFRDVWPMTAMRSNDGIAAYHRYQ